MGGDTPSEALSPDRSSSSIDDAGNSLIFGEKDGEVLSGDGVSQGKASMKGGKGRGGGGGEEGDAEITRSSYEVSFFLQLG